MNISGNGFNIFPCFEKSRLQFLWLEKIKNCQLVVIYRVRREGQNSFFLFFFFFFIGAGLLLRFYLFLRHFES